MKPHLTWTSVLTFALGATLMVAAFRYSSLLVCSVGSLLAISAVAMAYKQGWARWLAVAGLVVLLGIDVAAWSQQGFSPRRLIVAAVAVTLLAGLGRQLYRAHRARNRPLVSFVQLRRSTNGFLTDNKLAEIASRIWGVPFGTDKGGSETNYVVGQSPAFIVNAPDGILLLVNNFNQPYFNDPAEAAAELHELRVRHAIASHSAWQSVDLLTMSDTRRDPAEAYPAIAKLFVELLDDDTLAVLVPETGRILPYEARLVEKLRSDDPMHAFREITYAPVLEVADDNPRMQEAVAEARRRWPEFVAAFQARDGKHFAIKAPVTVDGNTEFIWIEVDRIENSTVHGRLANDPVALGDLRCGDSVSIDLNLLNDWNYIANEELKGGFTIKVLQEISDRGENAA